MILHWHWIEKCILLLSVTLSLSGCGNEANKGQKQDSVRPDYLDPKKTPSAHWFLSAKDVEKFRIGRSKDEILKDIQWRGNFSASARHQEKDICAIAYDVFSDPVSREGGEGTFAIFEDGKFLKFIKWQPWQPADYIEIINEFGSPARRPRPVKIGDYHVLLRYYKSEPLNMKDLALEVEKQAPAPSQIDPGLTAAVLALKGLGLFPAATSKDEFARNAKLRHQFNGSRLKIGMSEQEVEAILKTDAHESGEVQAGIYKIYGSNKLADISGDISWPLRFMNLMVLYKEGKLSWISSIESYEGRHEDLEELYIDFPVVP